MQVDARSPVLREYWRDVSSPPDTAERLYLYRGLEYLAQIFCYTAPDLLGHVNECRRRLDR